MNQESLKQMDVTLLTEDELVDLDGGNWWKVIRYSYAITEAAEELWDGVVAGWNAADEELK